MDIWISLSAYEVENPDLVGNFGRKTGESDASAKARVRQSLIDGIDEETDSDQEQDQEVEQEPETVLPTLEEQKSARSEYFSSKDVDDTVREHDEALYKDTYGV